MWQLFQYPLCPFSRKVRFALAEKGVAHELVREYPWDKRDEFTDLNPAGQTPVLVATSGALTLIDSNAICEYFEETVERTPLLGAGPAERAETRRLVAWFDTKFFAEAGVLLLQERMFKRLVARSSPDATLLRAAGRAVEHHLDYIEYLLDHRRWLGGSTFGLADIAAAAHLSVADYLNGVDWTGHAGAKQWYSAIKSRPTFRPLLADRMEGLAPPQHYDKLDF
ncbi:MAG: glutathione S-transferase family protein [Alphaproteobacteria bacterium]|nr:glutathione S-transferase family protein [Alphaproteobacteria bacterium]